MNHLDIGFGGVVSSFVTLMGLVNLVGLGHIYGRQVSYDQGSAFLSCRECDRHTLPRTLPLTMANGTGP